MNNETAQTLLQVALADMEYEYQTNSKLIRAVPEDKRDYRPHEKSRTAKELAWHLAASDVWFLTAMANCQFPMDTEPPPPETIAGILQWYEQNYPAALEKVKAMDPSKLCTNVDFFGMFNRPAVTYTNFLCVHTAHHRGQLSVYLRMMGEKVPSIYGGSADEPMAGAAQA